MDSFIPKEKLTAYERWELAAFDEAERAAQQSDASPAADAANATDALAAPPMPDSAEIERQIQEAFATAREIGHAEGLREGYAAGEAAGREAGLAEVHLEAERLAALAENFAAALRSSEAQLGNELLELALSIARQVVRAQVRSHPDWLIDVVREAMLALPSQHGHPTLYVHPGDAAMVRERLADSLAHTGWRIAEDATIEPGGCRVENGASEVDATLASRWKRVVEAIGTRADWHEESS